MKLSLAIFLSLLSLNYFNAQGIPHNKSHDFHYEDWITERPPVFTGDFKLPGDFPFISDYLNINVSANQFPQNEPSVKISPSDPNNVVVAWRDFRTQMDPPLRRVGYSYSLDGGYTWALSKLLPSFDSVHPLNSDPAVCADLQGNFYISTISITIETQLPIVTVYKSTNSGANFFSIVNLTPNDTIAQYFANDKEYLTCDIVANSPYKNNIYVAWSHFSPSKVLSRSTDFGNTWSELIFIDTAYDGVGLVPVVGDAGDLYIISTGASNDSDYGIYFNKSTNGGLGFQNAKRISLIKNSGFTIRLPSMAVDLSNGPLHSSIYAVWSNEYLNTVDEDVYLSYSRDRGETWSAPKRLNNDSLGNGVRQYWPWVTVDGKGNVFVIYYNAVNPGFPIAVNAYLAISTNGGIDFTNERLSTQSFPIESPHPIIRFGDYIGIDSWNNKIIPVWTDQRAGLYNMEIYCSVITDTVIGIKPVAENIPQQFSLSQNYPNPFNPTTHLRFEIPELRFVKLVIYDILGREVTTLVNEQLKPGVYEVDWVGSNFSSGVYFYSLITGGFTQTKKLILLK